MNDTYDNAADDRAMLAEVTGSVSLLPYEVTVTRIETVTFAVNADSPEDALERYLLDGDEVRSKLRASEVDSVDLVQPGA